MLAPLDHYRYLTTARRRLLEAVKRLSPEQYVREFPFGLHTVRRTLHHMAGAEWFVLGQLPAGLPSDRPGENPFSPRRVSDAVALDAAWKALEPRTVEIITGETDWNRPVEITVVIPGNNSKSKRPPSRRLPSSAIMRCITARTSWRCSDSWMLQWRLWIFSCSPPTRSRTYVLKGERRRRRVQGLCGREESRNLCEGG